VKELTCKTEEFTVSVYPTSMQEVIFAFEPNLLIIFETYFVF